jgi:hypothetical protein
MQEHDQQWDTDQKRGGQLEDGDYDQARLVECRVEQSEKTGGYQWYMKFEATVGTGDEAWTGAIRKWTGLDNEMGRQIAAQDAKRLGYTGKLSGLETACEAGEFDDLVCAIRVKTKAGEDRDYTNVYINKVHGRGAGTTAASNGAATMDDDIPF